MPRERTLADGQLGITAATLLAGTSASSSGRIDIVAYNITAVKQTVTLTFQLGGGTARQIASAELEEDQGLIVRGLPIQAGDTLLGVTTGAAAVDYVISASDSREYSITVMEKTGSVKRPTDITLATTEKTAMTLGEITISGQLASIEALLMKIA